MEQMEHLSTVDITISINKCVIEETGDLRITISKNKLLSKVYNAIETAPSASLRHADSLRHHFIQFGWDWC